MKRYQKQGLKSSIAPQKLSDEIAISDKLSLNKQTSFPKNDKNSSACNGKVKACEEKLSNNRIKSKTSLQNVLKRAKPDATDDIDNSPDLSF